MIKLGILSLCGWFCGKLDLLCRSAECCWPLNRVSLLSSTCCSHAWKPPSVVCCFIAFQRLPVAIHDCTCTVVYRYDGQVNGHVLYGRSHLNASAIIKSVTTRQLRILLLR